MLVRRERSDDVAAVRALIGRAFGGDGPEPVEVGLLDALRADGGWCPEFSLVVEEHGDPIGHVVATRGTVGEAPALGVGPVAVEPAHQCRGVGSALMHALMGAAQARDETLLALLGEPAYYRRFGFRPASTMGILAPDAAWGTYFQARALVPDSPTGTFAYAAPFAAVIPEDVTWTGTPSSASRSTGTGARRCGRVSTG